MSNTLLHHFVSVKVDDPDTTLVRPSNWNHEHIFGGGTNGLYLRYNSSNSDHVEWARALPFIDVTQPPYNAVAGADCTTAIQDAIDDLTYGVVLLPPNSPAQPYIVTGLTGKSNVSILGFNSYVQLKAGNYAAGDANVIKYTSKTDFSVRGLVVDGNYTNITGATRINGIVASACSNFSFEYNEVTLTAKLSGTPPGIGISAGGSSQDYTIAYNYIHDCGDVTNTSDAIFTDGRNFTVSFNRIVNCTDTAVAYNPSSANSADPDTGIVISDNISIDTPQGIGYGAVAARYCDGLVCSNNTVTGAEAANGGAIVFLNVAGSELRSLVCTGNTVKDTVLGKGIFISNVSYVTCEDNIVQRSDITHNEAGIYILDSTGVVCSGNNSSDNGGHGIVIAGCVNFAVNGNVCISNGAALTAGRSGVFIGKSAITATESNDGFIGSNTITGSPTQYGITITDATDNVTINDSVFAGLASTDYNIASTATVSQGNFTITGTGFTASVTATAYFRVIGDICMLEVPILTGTSNSVAFTLTGIPAHITPTTNISQLVSVTDNGVDIAGRAQFSASSTTVTLYPGPGTPAWTAAGTKTLRACLFWYNLR